MKVVYTNLEANLGAGVQVEEVVHFLVIDLHVADLHLGLNSTRSNLWPLPHQCLCNVISG
jgi:hypothetical protein